MTCTETEGNKYVTKDPDEVLDYLTDWTDRLVEGETITTSTWHMTEDDGAPTTSNPSKTDTAATVWLSGGDIRSAPYELTNRIVTNQGRTYDRLKYVTIQER